ncbi:MAG TPA: hypothetical protein VMX94_11195 [Armatimonadota bacterium]|nr:hypothetical protein [Armatimonadota bacterium]
MSRFHGVIITVAVMCCLLAASAAADRLVLIPTGRTLSTGGIKAEYAANSDIHDARIYWVNLGVSRVELEGARFEGFGAEDIDAVSAQIAVLPETSFTPAVALGVRDISDETDGRGMPYDGQSFFLAVSKSVPVTGGVPLLFRDVKLHGGIGTGSLSGIFFGVEGTLPMGIRLAGEYDTEDFNFSASYNVVPTIKARVSSMRGDVYYGAVFSTSF